MASSRGLALGVAACIALLLAQSARAQRDDVVELAFADFFVQPVGPRGLTATDALRAADGRRVRLVGYMVAQEQPLPGRFLLTPLPLRMAEHADGEADDLPPSTVHVLLDPSQRERIVAHVSGRLVVTGELQVGRAEDADGRVSWLRLQLDPSSQPISPKQSQP